MNALMVSARSAWVVCGAAGFAVDSGEGGGCRAVAIGGDRSKGGGEGVRYRFFVFGDGARVAVQAAGDSFDGQAFSQKYKDIAAGGGQGFGGFGGGCA